MGKNSLLTPAKLAQQEKRKMFHPICWLYIKDKAYYRIKAYGKSSEQSVWN